MVLNSSTTAGAWGSPRYVNSTGTADDHRVSTMVAVDSRELALTRAAAMNAETTVARMEEKFKTLEAKFDKAIEILTARGINITEML